MVTPLPVSARVPHTVKPPARCPHCGPYEEMLSRKVVSHPFRTRDEAEAMAKRAAESHQDAHGYNEEHGYWWGRDLRNKVYRFIIERV
jgi:hypothetical protein